MTTEERLVLTRTEAARLCSLTPAGFDVWVRKGIVPGPIPGTRRWSKAALKRALGGEESANRGDIEDVYEEWKRANDPDATLERELKANARKTRSKR